MPVLVGLNVLTGLQLLLWLSVALFDGDFSSPIAPDTVFQKLNDPRALRIKEGREEQHIRMQNRKTEPIYLA